MPVRMRDPTASRRGPPAVPISAGESAWTTTSPTSQPRFPTRCRRRIRTLRRRRLRPRILRSGGGAPRAGDPECQDARSGPDHRQGRLRHPSAGRNDRAHRTCAGRRRHRARAADRRGARCRDPDRRSASERSAAALFRLPQAATSGDRSRRARQAAGHGRTVPVRHPRAAAGRPSRRRFHRPRAAVQRRDSGTPTRRGAPGSTRSTSSASSAPSPNWSSIC